MTRTSVIAVGDVLLVTLDADLDDSQALRLQEVLTTRIRDDSARAVVIDISQLDLVDSFLGRVLAEVAACSRLLAAETVVVGMRPAVAVTLVELGLALPDMRTALNVDAALSALDSPLVRLGHHGRHGNRAAG